MLTPPRTLQTTESDAVSAQGSGEPSKVSIARVANRRADVARVANSLTSSPTSHTQDSKPENREEQTDFHIL